MVTDKLGIRYCKLLHRQHHIKRIYDKLHISSLGEAIAWYYKACKNTLVV